MNEIEIEEDLRHQEIAWKIKRISFCIIFLMVAIAFLGLFGQGLLSNAEISSSNTTIVYSRFIRSGASGEFIINSKYDDSLIVISLNNDYLKKIKIDRIIPLPDKEKSGNLFTDFLFTRSEKDKSIFIKINYSPEEPGLAEANFVINDKNFKIKQFVYP